MEVPGKQPPDFAATEFSAEIRAHVKTSLRAFYASFPNRKKEE